MLNRPVAQPETTVHEVVAVFDDVKNLRDAIAELQENQFMRQELSFLANEKTVAEKMGDYYYKVQDIADDHKTPRALFMPDEPVGEAEAALVGVPLYLAAITATCVVVASGGTLLAALAAASAAGLGAGALGGILASYIAKHHADYIQTQIERGGMILWVHSRSPEREAMAQGILSRHAPKSVHIHEVLLRDHA